MTQTKVGKKPNHVSNIFNRRDFFWANFFLYLSCDSESSELCCGGGAVSSSHQFTFYISAVWVAYAWRSRFYEKCLRYDKKVLVRPMGSISNSCRFDRSNGTTTTADATAVTTTRPGKLVGNKLIQLICFHYIASAISFRPIIQHGICAQHNEYNFRNQFNILSQPYGYWSSFIT